MNTDEPGAVEPQHKKTKTNLAQRRSGAEKNKSKKLCVSAPLREDKSI